MIDCDDAPPIYLSRISINGIDEVIGWSCPRKAKQYLEDRTPGNVEWESEVSDEGVRVATVNGEIAGRVERIPIADPASLTSTIEKYPSPRQIIDPDSIREIDGEDRQDPDKSDE